MNPAYPKTTREMVKDAYPPRPQEVRKYDYGQILVIGGSEFYSGAPALAGLAGFRAGADMVRLIAPKRAADIIASFSPILAAYGLDNHHLNATHLATLLTMTESAKEVARGKAAVVIGGGLGRTAETQDAVITYLSQTNVPTVIDADALHAVVKNLGAIHGKPFLLTPNMYEFFVLTGKQVFEQKIEGRIKAVKEEAARLGTTILLKGQFDIISNGEETYVNETGSPYLSVGGTGDTLAGICGALLARGLSLARAGAVAAYINGKAGEIAGKKYKESMVATDVIEAICEAIA